MKKIIKKFLKPISLYIDNWKLPAEAKREKRKDKLGLVEKDPGIDTVAREAVNWIYRAQDNSLEGDGGVARHYSLISGWGHSYPETTGYIVPTLLDWHKCTGEKEALTRARRMLDWFLKIQFPEGAFQGGMIHQEPKKPVTFNTGQILLGLAAGARMFPEDYTPSMEKAADWLRDTQEDDGSWQRYPTPFAKSGLKVYETHVAWGLLEADRGSPDRGYGEAGMKNINWAITKQRENGWFEDCCLDDPTNPLTHTIGYVLRGILEGYRYSGEDKLLQSAIKALNNILPIIDQEGRLPGRLDFNWKPTVNWACLTGCSQIAICLFMAYRAGSNEEFFKAGRLLNSFVRRTMYVNGSLEKRGGVKGSFPVSGDYGKFEFLNWAAKFTIDANLMEKELLSR